MVLDGKRRDRKVCYTIRGVDWGLMVVLTSEENEVLYLECYRFVLQGQIKALKALGLPNELEVKCIVGLY
jgi:hypothetical protein